MYGPITKIGLNWENSWYRHSWRWRAWPSKDTTLVWWLTRNQTNCTNIRTCTRSLQWTEPTWTANGMDWALKLTSILGMTKIPMRQKNALPAIKSPVPPMDWILIDSKPVGGESAYTICLANIVQEQDETLKFTKFLAAYASWSHYKLPPMTWQEIW